MGVTFPSSVLAERLVIPGVSTQAPCLAFRRATYRRAKRLAAVDRIVILAKRVDRRISRRVVGPGPRLQMPPGVKVYEELIGALRVVVNSETPLFRPTLHVEGVTLASFTRG